VTTFDLLAETSPLISDKPLAGHAAIEATPDVPRSVSGPWDAEPPARNGATPKITWGQLSDVAMKSIRFADKPLWQRGAFHLVCGMKGAGKGTYLSNLAARVTRGELGPNCRVIWIASGEDSHAIDVRPRILAAGGDDTLVTYVHRGHIKLPDHVEEIRRKALELVDVGLIVLDPVSASLGSGKNSNQDVDVREAIAPLNELADELDAVVVGVRHVGKDRSRGALSSVLGSVEWVNVPRAVLVVAADDEEEGLHHIQAIAGNRVAKGSSGRSFRIEGVLMPEHPEIEEEVTRAVETGDSGKDVEELLANQLPGRKRVAAATVQDIILEQLATGEKSREYIDTVCKDQVGANPDSVYKSGLAPLKKVGKITARKDGMSGGWHWRLES
jgi:AAA domain